MSLRLALPIVFIGVLLLSSAGGITAQEGGPDEPAGGLSVSALAGTGFTYQGELRSAGSPVNSSCDFQFGLWDALAAGAQLGGTQAANVTVAGGRFTVVLNAGGQFGARAFDGSARWLAIAVRCPAGGGSYTNLSPRQALTAAPLAFALPGLRTEPNATSPNVVGGYISNTVGVGVVGATIGGGGLLSYANSVTANYGTVGGGGGNIASGDAATVAGGSSNTASGNSATVGGGWSHTASGDAATIAGGSDNFAGYIATVGGGYHNTASGNSATIAGGSDNFAGYIATVGGGASNSAGYVATVGGGSYNIASSDFATVGGGHANTASGDNATVGGGYDNTASHFGTTVAGGDTNIASNNVATVGGGYDNTASGGGATVCGGVGNTASANSSVVCGGSANLATGYAASIGGGVGNTASGDYAAVAGGADNFATGAYSFAAGRNAVAQHSGAFVWAGDSDKPVESTVPNQFLVQAAGGVLLTADESGATGCQLSAGGGTWDCTSDRNAKANFAPVDGVDILNTLAGLPIETWNFTTQDADIRHMGPMAQDWYAAFALGEGDTTISAVDVDGVALAAIQGLYSVIQEKDTVLASQQAEIAALTERVAALESAAAAGNVARAPSTNTLQLLVVLVLGLAAASAWARSHSGASGPRTWL